MPVEVTRHQRQLCPDELALIHSEIDRCKHPVMLRAFAVSFVIGGALALLTLLVSSDSPFVIIFFWFLFSAMMGTWVGVSMATENNEKLTTLESIPSDSDPAVMDVEIDQPTNEELGIILHPKIDHYLPEAGDQLIVKRYDGELNSIEFVQSKRQVVLTA